MDLINLGIIFVILIAVMLLRKPLYISLGLAILAVILLYRIPIQEVGGILTRGIFSRSTILLVLAFYAITFLQRMLEKRDRLTMAEIAVSNLFQSRRVNAMVIPFLIGFLPSPGAVLIAKPIVDKAVGDSLPVEETTVITSYYRHISESFLPTYASVMLAIQLSGVSISSFVLAMLPVVVILFALGYFIYVRKVPSDTGLPPSGDRKQDLINFLRGIWPILLAVVLIVSFSMPVVLALIPVIILYFFVEKFSFKEITPFFKSAFEKRMTFIVIAAMVFREALAFSGMIERLPSYFTGLPIPVEMVFAILMFVGTLIAGTQAMIAIVVPLAFSAIPDGGLALLILLMSLSYIAMQISPTHVCLGIVTEAYKTSFASLVKKTIPLMIPFIVVIFAYFYLLRAVF